MALGSFSEGLKNRWFTLRTSTAMRVFPELPSAAPKPVMLFIMWYGLCYEATMTLSIPELPANTIDIEGALSKESGEVFISVAGHVPKLVTGDATKNSDLQ